ncbi:MAG: holin [Bacillales bacterium]|nr:holin [Bacillales bacterium]
MKLNLKNRIRNYGFWISVIALIPMTLKGFGIDVLPENYSEIANTILGLLVFLGIVNNPTTESKGFSDDVK